MTTAYTQQAPHRIHAVVVADAGRGAEWGIVSTLDVADVVAELEQ